MSKDNKQESNSLPRGLSWVFSVGSNRNNENRGESTPLLSNQPVDAPAPQAPPPSTAPPTPLEIPVEPDDSSRSQQSHISKSSFSSTTRSKRKKNAPDPAVEAADNIKKTIADSIRKKFEGPNKRIVHVFLDFVRFTAALSSVMMLGMQVVPLIRLVRADDSEFNIGLQVVVRIYIMVFSVFFILVEARLRCLKRFFSGFNWILLGFLYSFIGVVGMEQDLAIKVEDIESSKKTSIFGPDYMTMMASLFMSLTTWLMISVGIVYMILGVLCIQGWYERMELNHNEKVLKWKTAQRVVSRSKRRKGQYKECEEGKKEEKGDWYDDIPDG